MSQEKNTAAWIIQSVNDGDVDPYLRAIVEAIKDRRGWLMQDGGALPKQLTVTADDAGPGVHLVGVAGDQPPVTTTPPKVKAKVVNTSPAFHKDHRPDPKIHTYKGRFTPTQGAMNPVTLLGVTYEKADLMGKCIVLGLAGYDTRVQIVGVGPKMVKVLVVDEPPRGTYHGKKELHSLWEANMPLFLAHSVLSPYLSSSIN